MNVVFCSIKAKGARLRVIRRFWSFRIALHHEPSVDDSKTCAGDHYEEPLSRFKCQWKLLQRHVLMLKVVNMRLIIPASGVRVCSWQHHTVETSVLVMWGLVRFWCCNGALEEGHLHFCNGSINVKKYAETLEQDYGRFRRLARRNNLSPLYLFQGRILKKERKNLGREVAKHRRTEEGKQTLLEKQYQEITTKTKQFI